MTFDDMYRQYTCEVVGYKDNMNKSTQIVFKFPGYAHMHIISSKDMQNFKIEDIEDNACRCAVESYNKYLNDSGKASIKLAEAGESLDGMSSKLTNSFLPMQYELDSAGCFMEKSEFKPEIEDYKPPKISEVYSLSFDMSGGKDISVCVVFKNCGDHFKEIGVFTGEDALWMYRKINKIEV